MAPRLFGGEVDGGEFAAVIDFDVEGEPLAFDQSLHTCALHGADVDERIGLAIVARDKAEALGLVEEFYRARGALAGQLAAATRAMPAIS